MCCLICCFISIFITCFAIFSHLNCTILMTNDNTLLANSRYAQEQWLSWLLLPPTARSSESGWNWCMAVLRNLNARLTLTGSSVAEKAFCRAQQASLHISSVNTGPAVTRTYLKKKTENIVVTLASHKNAVFDFRRSERQTT